MNAPVSRPSGVETVPPVPAERVAPRRRETVAGKVDEDPREDRAPPVSSDGHAGSGGAPGSLLDVVG